MVRPSPSTGLSDRQRTVQYDRSSRILGSASMESLVPSHGGHTKCMVDDGIGLLVSRQPSIDGLSFSVFASLGGV